MNQSLLDVETQLSQPALVPGTNPQVVYALVRIKPGGGAGPERLPLDIRFVLDRSGSMSAAAGKGTRRSRIHLVREATCAAIQQMEPGDQLAVYSFDDHNQTDVTPRVLRSTNDVAESVRRVKRITCGGGTHLSESLKLAVRVNSNDPACLKRVIVFTDGEVNIPSQNSEERGCKKLAAEAANRGVPLLLLGTGVDYHEGFLEALAAASGGRMEHVHDAQRVLQVFAEEIRTMADVAVTNLEVSVSCASGARLAGVSRVVPDIHPYQASHPNYFATFLGDLDRARGQALLLTLEIPAASGAEVDLAALEFTFDVPTRGMRGVKARAAVRLPVDASAAMARNQDVIATVRVDGATRLQTLALQQAAGGDLATAAGNLDRVATLYGSAGLQDLAAQTRVLTNQIRTGAASQDVLETRRTLTTAARKAVTTRMLGTKPGGGAGGGSVADPHRPSEGDDLAKGA